MHLDYYHNNVIPAIAAISFWAHTDYFNVFIHMYTKMSLIPQILSVLQWFRDCIRGYVDGYFLNKLKFSYLPSNTCIMIIPTLWKLQWIVLSYMVASPFPTRVALYRMFAVISVCEMIDILWIYQIHASASTRLRGIFIPLDLLWKYRIELVAMDLACIVLRFCKGCSRLCHWLSLWCFGFRLSTCHLYIGPFCWQIYSK